MKKLVAAGVSGLLMLGVASQASASFNQGDLIMSVYDTTLNTEIGVDLGSMSTISADIKSGGSTTLATGLSFTGFTSSDGIGIYSDNSNPNSQSWEGWFAVKTSNYSGSSINKYNTNATTFSNSYQTIIQGYNFAPNVTSATTAQEAATFADSYKMLMDFTTPAGYAGVNKTANLQGLLPTTAGSYTDMYLYHFDSNSNNNIVLADPTYDAVIRLTSDGTVILNPGQSNVPVPGAVWLLGSGLAGLAGIRRRKNS